MIEEALSVLIIFGGLSLFAFILMGIIILLYKRNRKKMLRENEEYWNCMQNLCKR